MHGGDVKSKDPYSEGPASHWGEGGPADRLVRSPLRRGACEVSSSRVRGSMTAHRKERMAIKVVRRSAKDRRGKVFVASVVAVQVVWCAALVYLVVHFL
jgi:hypothetical protein